MCLKSTRANNAKPNIKLCVVFWIIVDYAVVMLSWAENESQAFWVIISKAEVGATSTLAGKQRVSNSA